MLVLGVFSLLMADSNFTECDFGIFKNLIARICCTGSLGVLGTKVGSFLLFPIIMICLLLWHLQVPLFIYWLLILCNLRLNQEVVHIAKLDYSFLLGPLFVLIYYGFNGFNFITMTAEWCIGPIRDFCRIPFMFKKIFLFLFFAYSEAKIGICWYQVFLFLMFDSIVVGMLFEQNLTTRMKELLHI